MESQRIAHFVTNFEILIEYQRLRIISLLLFLGNIILFESLLKLNLEIAVPKNLKLYYLQPSSGVVSITSERVVLCTLTSFVNQTLHESSSGNMAWGVIWTTLYQNKYMCNKCGSCSVSHYFFSHVIVLVRSLSYHFLSS